MQKVAVQQSLPHPHRCPALNRHLPVRPSSHRRGQQLALAVQQGAASTTTTAPTIFQGRRARAKEDLNDPAQIGAAGTADCKVTDYGGPLSLSSYMTLPVEQYFVLDPKQIRWIEANRFHLVVPRIEILSVWLEPEVEISVTSTADRVVLKAENCRIRGSDIIENMKLDQKFCMRFATEMTWRTTPLDAASSASSDGSDADDSRNAPVGRGVIVGKAQLDVWSEVIPPFNLMPREVLQASCNIVMSGLVGTLLPMFLNRLGADYMRWATDAPYRADRAARSRPLH